MDSLQCHYKDKKQEETVCAGSFECLYRYRDDLCVRYLALRTSPYVPGCWIYFYGIYGVGTPSDRTSASDMAVYCSGVCGNGQLYVGRSGYLYLCLEAWVVGLSRYHCSWFSNDALFCLDGGVQKAAGGL